LLKLADSTPPATDPHAGHNGHAGHGGMEMPAADAGEPGPVGDVVSFEDLAAWQPSTGWLSTEGMRAVRSVESSARRATVLAVLAGLSALVVDVYLY
jgi:hypothetical protein